MQQQRKDTTTLIEFNFNNYDSDDEIAALVNMIKIKLIKQNNDRAFKGKVTTHMH